MASVRSLATRRGRTSSSRRTKPAMSMPNLVVSGFPSGIGVISRTCRERGASIAMTMSGAMRPRQTPYLPACSGNPAVSSALLTRSLHAYNFACVARTMLLSIEQVRLDPPAFFGQSRATLPVAQRLEQLLAIDPRPLAIARPGASRALATCRRPGSCPGLWIELPSAAI
jgi:hypothetical protein